MGWRGHQCSSVVMNTEEAVNLHKNKTIHNLNNSLPGAKGVRLKSVLVPEMLLAAPRVSLPPMSSGHWDPLTHLCLLWCGDGQVHE